MTAQDPVTPADATLAGFLQSIALAVADVYDKVIALLGDSTKPMATTFQNHHKEHAVALAIQAGSASATLPNQALTLVLAARLQTVTDERGALTFAFGVEHQVTATYASTFNTLTSPDVVRLVATILTTVSGHAGALGSSAGLTPTAVFPDGALQGATVGDGSDPKLGFDPASFPVN
ncbi:MAG: hypothetical protein QOG30_653 [Acidimicrobiaceae bacterium]|jgi:hypothetical protein